MRRLAFALAMSLCAAPVFGEEGFEAIDVVEAMVDTYRTCASYRDRGRQTIEFGLEAPGEPGAPPIRDVLEFTTLFRRPDALLFEYHETSNESRVAFGWAREPDPMESGAVRMFDGVVSSWSSPAVQADIDGDLEAALWRLGSQASGFYGVTRRLLLPSTPHDYQFLDVEMGEEVAHETVGGRSCYRIRGRMSGDAQATLWIDEETYVLRRVRQSFGQDYLFGALTFEYEPELNPMLDDEQFFFEIPAEVDRRSWISRSGAGPYVGALIAAAFGVFVVVMIGLRRPDQPEFRL